MKEQIFYLTITHINDYSGSFTFRPGQRMILQKDHENPYDDEAIAVYTEGRQKCGYVANSVGTVARGTCSAGRAYDRLPEQSMCIIRFVLEECMIAETAEEMPQAQEAA